MNFYPKALLAVATLMLAMACSPSPPTCLGVPIIAGYDCDKPTQLKEPESNEKDTVSQVTPTGDGSGYPDSGEDTGGDVVVGDDITDSDSTGDEPVVTEDTRDGCNGRGCNAGTGRGKSEGKERSSRDGD